MKPTALSVKWLLLWWVIGICASFLPSFPVVWIAAGAALLLLALIDALCLLRCRALAVEREVPERLPLGEVYEVQLKVRNFGKRALRVELFDAYPDCAEVSVLPWSGSLPAGKITVLAYSIRFLERGLHHFGQTHLWVNSPLRFWQKKSLVGDAGEIRVYPNYEPIIRHSLLTVDNLESQMGIVRKNRTGASKEFHQLRDYHEGDVLSQIDWKATARHQRLITREYQEQRDQNIILLTDCGNRMRAMDGKLTQFDHLLNAMLLLSYIAIRQGDRVGVLSFGGTNRWLAPVKGPRAMPIILDHLYDYQTSTQASDFSEAVERLLIHQKRRALVVVLTNLRSEHSKDLVPSLQLLREKHLVLLANLREHQVDRYRELTVKGFNSALTYCANYQYLSERLELFQRLQALRIRIVDESAQNLPIAMTNQYLNIKSAGLL